MKILKHVFCVAIFGSLLVSISLNYLQQAELEHVHKVNKDLKNAVHTLLDERDAPAQCCQCEDCNCEDCKCLLGEKCDCSECSKQ